MSGLTLREAQRIRDEARRMYLRPLYGCRCLECRYRRGYARAEKERARRLARRAR